MRQNILLLIILFFFLSCNEEGVDVPDFVPIDSDRVVLIEELTGVSCTNCPAGSAELENLKANYGNKVVSVAIHGNFLAEPTPKSKYDFRTEKSAALEQYLNPWDGKPAASINRVKYSEELSNSKPDEWSGLVELELEKEHVLNMDLTVDYDTISREAKITVTLIPKVDLGSENRLTVMIIENHIIDAQKNQQGTVEDYEHNHVLRDILTATEGNPINKELKKDIYENIFLDYMVPFDENLWQDENLEIVAFVNRDNGSEKLVLQAAIAHLKE